MRTHRALSTPRAATTTVEAPAIVAAGEPMIFPPMLVCADQAPSRNVRMYTASSWPRYRAKAVSAESTASATDDLAAWFAATADVATPGVATPGVATPGVATADVVPAGVAPALDCRASAGTPLADALAEVRHAA